MSNANLHKSKIIKNDEFYTTLPDIDKELSHYDLSNKIILCNCNDSLSSAFTQYFIKNFQKLNLKKLITIYPYTKLTYNGDTIQTERINNNGDFRLNTDILQEIDIVITNPPFSLFREFITQLFKYNKNFLII